MPFAAPSGSDPLNTKPASSSRSFCLHLTSGSAWLRRDESVRQVGFRYQLKSQKSRIGIDSLTPVRSALAGLRSAMRDKFLSPFPKRLKSITDGAIFRRLKAEVNQKSAFISVYLRFE